MLDLDLISPPSPLLCLPKRFAERVELFNGFPSVRGISDSYRAHGAGEIGNRRSGRFEACSRLESCRLRPGPSLNRITSLDPCKSRVTHKLCGITTQGG